ncbi:nucleoside triphosphate pyrophosphohydrolase [Shewanella sp. SR44-3]|uniref:nucleoside triphosphate pyrophosphohydrolase n=1 Tax=Shewanella sp. SR44-3 TaxID=2760936 RepID=UPI002175DE7C|nr:nucleoside triphosphate pyrophosphohydrolase [Shewanella sp. SR44-3]
MSTEKTVGLQALLAIMEKLRNPETGCPWDLAQRFDTLVPFTIEEAFEVAEVIEHHDLSHLPDELGDLLFQVVFYCQLGKEQGLFDFATVVERISAKLIRRHPHVFGAMQDEFAANGAKSELNTQALNAAWENAKALERQQKQLFSVLDDIPQALPALTRSLKIQKRVAKVGFDWPNLAPVVAKIHEEIDEVMVEARLLESDPETYLSKVKDEMGDLLFAVVNLARHLGVDPESALRQGNHKFEQRFRGVEALADASGKSMEAHSLEELDGYWDQVKARLKAAHKE